MTDPNDFTNRNEPEGEEEGNPKAGYPGVGGLSTQDAEDAYTKAKDQHFADETTHRNEKNQDKDMPEESTKTIPQIGSIDKSHEQDID